MFFLWYQTRIVKKITSFQSRCFIIYLSASYLEENEEFFTSVEKSWQIESYSEFESEWTKVDKDSNDSEEPEMLEEVPDMTCPSDILKYLLFLNTYSINCLFKHSTSCSFKSISTCQMHWLKVDAQIFFKVFQIINRNVFDADLVFFGHS